MATLRSRLVDKLAARGQFVDVNLLRVLVSGARMSAQYKGLTIGSTWKQKTEEESLTALAVSCTGILQQRAKAKAERDAEQVASAAKHAARLEDARKMLHRLTGKTKLPTTVRIYNPSTDETLISLSIERFDNGLVGLYCQDEVELSKLIDTFGGALEVHLALEGEQELR